MYDKTYRQSIWGNDRVCHPEKWDGYRAICTVHEDGRMELVSRNGLDFLAKFPELEGLKTAWTTLPIVVDGEIVSLDPQGRSSFQRLQESLRGGGAHLRLHDRACRFYGGRGERRIK